MAVPAIVTKDEWQAVQAHLKSRNPKWTPPRTVSGPTLLTGIAFCASCGGAMTLRTGKGGRYRHYTCSTRARQGSTGCGGTTVPMAKLDTAVASHIEDRLLDPRRLTALLSEVLNRRDDYIARRRTHITELRQRASEADAKLKRLYEAIENGIADLNDPALKGRVAELSAIRDQAHADAERAAGTIQRVGPDLTEEKVKAFASAARKRLRKSDGTYRRDHLRAVAQRIEVIDKTEARIMGSRTALLKTLIQRSFRRQVRAFDETDDLHFRMPGVSFVVAPIRDHAFFEQPQFQRLFSDDLFQIAGFSAQVFNLS